MQLAPGIARITLPLPTGPRHVHCYLIDGQAETTLVDTGLGLPGDPEPWQAVADRVDRIFVTHMHPDHVGGAERASAVTGARVHQGELDYAQCERVWGSDDWPERMAAWFRSHGVPSPVADDLIVQGHAFAPFVRFEWNPELVAPGESLDGWEVVAVPGHADGHLALAGDGVWIAGDHLLATISPAVGLYPESRPDPLGDYLASLRLVVELGPAVVYPGHGEPVTDPAARAAALLEHHRVRLDETAAALGTAARTAYEVAVDLFGSALPPAQTRFAVAETLSHLERLVAEGRAGRAEVGAAVAYTGS